MSAKQATYEMIAGGRIDGTLSHTGAFLLEVDGRWERVYDFRIVPCEGAQLTVYGTIKPDGQPDSRGKVYPYLVELLGQVQNPKTPMFGQVKGRVEGEDEAEEVFGLVTFGDGTMPFMYEEAKSGVGYLDVNRFVITCNT